MTYKKPAICWSCQRAGGSCQWTDRLIPIPGWEAEKNEETGAYRVMSCPEYDPGGTHTNDLDPEGAERLAARIVRSVCDDFMDRYEIVFRNALRGKVKSLDHQTALLRKAWDYFETEDAEYIMSGSPVYIREKLSERAAENMISDIIEAGLSALEKYTGKEIGLEDDERQEITKIALKILRTKRGGKGRRK